MSVPNHWFIGVRKGEFLLTRPFSPRPLTPDEALEVAALIVVMAQPSAYRNFADVLREAEES